MSVTVETENDHPEVEDRGGILKEKLLAFIADRPRMFREIVATFHEESDGRIASLLNEMALQDQVERKGPWWRVPGDTTLIPQPPQGESAEDGATAGKQKRPWKKRAVDPALQVQTIVEKPLAYRLADLLAGELTQEEEQAIFTLIRLTAKRKL